MITLDICEYMRQLNFYALLLGIKNHATTLGKGLAVSYKVKDAI